MSIERQAAHAGGRLSEEHFRAAVDMLPLVSIDLLVRDPRGRYLLGLRGNPPAQGRWFVPGGRIRKGEALAQALRRLADEELGMSLPPVRWRLRGVYEHFYDVNFAGESGMSTHYVVLAYQVQLPSGPLAAALPATQHLGYRWDTPEDAATDPDVHPYTKAYFTEQHP
ncbi:GDP-mannose mannosyl hydrolase [Bordetella sp. H567]|uniref:GDP-mannose mannosyl hydrolase n=1 Tax=Bordetella sp. H567 TaxID=1697043 RepID=UPI00081D2D06|nr:GDP-mannose mannosyl hydrolase [Bordetella sp. H567]AOB30548.1 GDP-mannose mannosyl hydrolase [Bordetella sp. H567]